MLPNLNELVTPIAEKIERFKMLDCALPTLFIISTSESIAIFILSTKSNLEETVLINAVILSSLGTNNDFNNSPNRSINLYTKKLSLVGFKKSKSDVIPLTTSLKPCAIQEKTPVLLKSVEVSELFPSLPPSVESLGLSVEEPPDPPEEVS